MTATTTAPDVNHRPGCEYPSVGTFTGRQGDLLARCHTCGRVRVLEPVNPYTPRPVTVTAGPVAVEVEPAPDEAPPVRELLRYRCRAHAHPVCWRGRGCYRCTEDRDAARAARRRKPKRAQPYTGEPMWTQ